jgi:transposase
MVESIAMARSAAATALVASARRVRPEPRAQPDEAVEALDVLLTRRRQLVEMLTAERNRLLVARAPVRRDLQQHIRFLERRLREAEDDLHTAVKASPVNRDSGTHRGKRLVYGGRAPVRAALYMAALVASKCNPVIRAFYQRLRPRASRPKWRSPPACGSCSPSSTRSRATARHGSPHGRS